MVYKEYKIGEIYDATSGLSKGADDFGFGYPFLPFKTVFANPYLPETFPELANATQAERKKCSIKCGDIFLTRTSETLDELGMSSVALRDYPDATFNGFTKRLRKKPNVNIEIDPYYLIYYFRSLSFRQQVTSMASLTTRASLNNSMIGRLSIFLPNINIQRKIGKYLFTVDKKISANNSVNNKLEEQMWAVYRNLFVNKDYKKVRLGDVINRITERVGEREAKVLSAVYTGSLVPSDEHFNKRVYSKDTAKYITVNEGDFAYNPARINIGSIGLNDLGYLGCVSPVYVVFKTEKNYRSFFRFYFRTTLFLEACKKLAYGSVRQTLNYKDFSNITVSYPKLEDATMFEQMWDRISTIIFSNNKQTECLEKIKTTIFDCFISGKLDADKLYEK